VFIRRIHVIFINRENNFPSSLEHISASEKARKQKVAIGKFSFHSNM
jgi:hypothetical protein